MLLMTSLPNAVTRAFFSAEVLSFLLAPALDSDDCESSQPKNVDASTRIW